MGNLLSNGRSIGSVSADENLRGRNVLIYLILCYVHCSISSPFPINCITDDPLMCMHYPPHLPTNHTHSTPPTTPNNHTHQPHPSTTPTYHTHSQNHQPHPPTTPTYHTHLPHLLPYKPCSDAQSRIPPHSSPVATPGPSLPRPPRDQWNDC